MPEDVTSSKGRRDQSADAIDSETIAFNSKLTETLVSLPRLWERPVQEVRDEGRRGNGAFPAPVYSERAYWRTVHTGVGDIRLRILPPASGRIDRVYYRIHGGGWTLGAPDFGESLMEELADATNALVVSVEYRLAPEHPYPAGPDDCEAVACWLAENAKAEFGTDRLFIGGESAGAHLSVVTLLRMRDRHGFTAFQGANLVYGCFDLTGTPSMQNWGDENLILDTPTMRWFFDQFVPQGDRRTHDVSPLYADLHNLPPALFTIGTKDPLFDDSLMMFERWRAAGNEADLAVYPGGVHAFNAFPLKIGRQANARCNAFLAR